MIREFVKRVALVTGASNGIGLATAHEFARLGANVVLADIVAGEKHAEAIGKTHGVRTAFISCDVSKKEDVARLVRETVGTFGRLDFACNNAGIEGVPGALEQCSDENWTRTIDINLKGVWLCMREQIPAIKETAGSGAIVNMSSIAGLVGFEGLAAYSASKHGIIGLTKTAALENAKTGIRVNAVCPGVIDTPMITRFTKGDAEAAAALTRDEPVGRIGTPDEIANAVVWLCSSKSSFVTGHPLVIDGGWVAR